MKFRLLVKGHRAAIQYAATLRKRSKCSNGQHTYNLLHAVYAAAFDADEFGIERRFLKLDADLTSTDIGFSEVVDSLLRNADDVECRKFRWKLASAAKWAFANHVSPGRVCRFVRDEGGLNACARALAQAPVKSDKSSWL